MEPVESALDRLQKELDRLVPRNTNKAEIHINAGGVGVWIATTACLVMLGMMAIAIPCGAAAYIALKDDIGDLERSDNAIRAYINTGVLKPKEEKKP